MVGIHKAGITDFNQRIILHGEPRRATSLRGIDMGLGGRIAALTITRAGSIEVDTVVTTPGGIEARIIRTGMIDAVRLVFATGALTIILGTLATVLGTLLSHLTVGNRTHRSTYGCTTGHTYQRA